MMRIILRSAGETRRAGCSRGNSRHVTLVH
jgi:hypothetical protein